jgi:hypothetical protein
MTHTLEPQQICPSIVRIQIQTLDPTYHPKSIILFFHTVDNTKTETPQNKNKNKNNTIIIDHRLTREQ